MLRKMCGLLFRNRKGQGLVEYGILIGGVAIVCIAAVSIFGHKTNDIIATVAAVLPGAHDDDNEAIVSGKLVQTTLNTVAGGLVLDVVNPGSMQNNYGFTLGNTNTLVVETN